MPALAVLQKPGSARSGCPALSGRWRRGFTLIELMVAVAIVAIIATVAYPQYTDSVRRSRLVEATGALASARVRLEQYYQDNRHYGSTATACGVAAPTGDNFTYSCTWGDTSSNQSFLLTATGKSSAGLGDAAYTVNQDNLQQTTAFPGASGLPVNCWLRRKGDTC
jgi:type IV pilus assembly protein PilE